nr:MAG: hypothetical protein [Eriocheir sinensis solspivirus 2]
MSLLPIGSTLYSVASNGNSITFALPGHTTVQPRLAIFKRVIPEFQKGTWSVPSYTYKVVYGVVDAESGQPVNPRISVGTDGVRWPMAGLDLPATFAAAHAQFASIAANPEMAARVFAQTLPGQADIASA